MAIMAYIAKKGGISSDMVFLLYGSKKLKHLFQYFRCTLNTLGYIMALGRYALPPLLLWTALDMSYFPFAVSCKRKIYLLFILPLISLVVYIPFIFKAFLGNKEILLKFTVAFTRSWTIAYVLLAVVTLVYEYFSITNMFFRRRFRSKSLLLLSIAVLYTVYSPQDPAQVYLFYNNDYMWMLGLWYLSSGFNSLLYPVVILLSVISSCLGLFSLYRYLSIQWDEERQEAVIKTKGRYAEEGVSMFIHATKNELLSSKVLIGRLERNRQEEKSLEQLKDINAKLLERMEKLYDSVKLTTEHLMAEHVKVILDSALKRAKRAYPEAAIVVEPYEEKLMTLVDREHVAEAISNILINGWEATLSKGSTDPLRVSVHAERLWSVITIEDKGCGISKEAQKHIWEPFYSSKNSSTNWGMGMYYVRRTIKDNLGYIRFESQEGEGTRFILMLPRFGRLEVKV